MELELNNSNKNREILFFGIQINFNFKLAQKVNLHLILTTNSQINGR